MPTEIEINAENTAGCFQADNQYQMIQAEKMDIIGKLAGNVAHEVKNPLEIVMLGIEYLQKVMKNDGPKNLGILNKMKDAVLRVDSSVRNLLDFSRITNVDFMDCNIENIIEASLDLVSKQLSLNNIVLVKEFKCKHPVVRADENRLKQVFITLFLNSINVMSGGGTLSVRIRNSKFGDIKHETIEKAARLFDPEKTAVVCEVEDTGKGIPQDKLGRVFDPFFSNKHLDEGLSLGTAKCIVDGHGGLIGLETEEGKGTKLTIVLPAHLGSKNTV
ncbi:MAG: ATP-binding protein [Candidatus Saganbacteria bacterium]|nr:ATP-binding protein [Candidatus Saganbacteria bacterium]